MGRAAADLRADGKDEGIVQWYGCGATARRGEYLIGMGKVLRDDLIVMGDKRVPCLNAFHLGPRDEIPAELRDMKPPLLVEGLEKKQAPVFGYGCTVLVWSRDNGKTWSRDDETAAFFAPDPRPDAWDHAHAWIDSAVPVGDEVWCYYGGYRYGHKVYTDRGIGLVKMKRDRYVARGRGDGRRVDHEAAHARRREDDRQRRRREGERGRRAARCRRKAGPRVYGRRLCRGNGRLAGGGSPMEAEPRRIAEPAGPHPVSTCKTPGCSPLPWNRDESRLSAGQRRSHT